MDLAAREVMVTTQIAARGICDPRVLDAMRAVPREAFVPEAQRAYAYDDGPLPIGEGQTISQPYIVACMLEALRLRPSDRVLEVGTGCGYAAAVISKMASEVYTIERHARLAEAAAARLGALCYDNVHVRHGDGMHGWPEAAPFQGISVPAGAAEPPPALLAQLAPGGRLVIPLGPSPDDQVLFVITHGRDGTWRREPLGPVRFVPLVAGASAP
jgi:protein-L-isoaspartate(D-aspartate) O-methyltransferase